MKSFLPILICLVFAVTSCKKNDPALLEWHLNEFDTLVLLDPFEIELIQDTFNKMVIAGSSQFVDKVKWNQENNTLTIENTANNRWLNPKRNKIKIQLHVNEINKIVANETCWIHSLNTLTSQELGLILKSKLNNAQLKLQCETFYYWNNFPCGGNLELSGTCQRLKLWNYALMQVNAKELLCTKAEIEQASKGSMHINCSDTLIYRIQGTGNLHVKGQPGIIVNSGSSGAGQVIFE